MDKEQQKQIKELDDKITRILFYLENDEKTGKKGLIGKVEYMEEVINDLVLKDKIKAAKVAGIGISGGAIFAVLEAVFRKFF